ncbi:hypothetical protein [Streptomyces sp. PTD5-9]|uniref:hypothetical protein n=1 Tax=Streptomyces sp. PTD5-9 TaxID=3120150 RepID=UPI0030094228
MTDSSHTRGAGDTKARHPVQETLAHPVQMVTTAVEKVPGADRAKEFVDGVLDSVGIVSPQARRVVAYTGAGLLGVAGVVEWPVAAAGAAAVWLTQQRPKEAATTGRAADEAGAGESRTKTSRAKASRATKRAATSAKTSAGGKAKSRPGKAGSGTTKSRAPKSAGASGTTKARASSRRTTSRSTAAKSTAAGGRKK